MIEHKKQLLIQWVSEYAQIKYSKGLLSKFIAKLSNFFKYKKMFLINIGIAICFKI